MPPSTLTGSLHPSNRGAFAWSENGIVAFGCHSVLAFFDVRRLEVFQTVDLHSTAINLICWKPSSNELLLRCASSDIGGNIVVCDVLEGRQCAMFRSSNTPVSDLQWLCWPDVSRDFLASLHSNNVLIVWDVGKKERLWEHRFGTSVFKLSIDPFDHSRIALSSQCASVLLVHGFSPFSALSSAAEPSPSSSSAMSNANNQRLTTTLQLEPKTLNAICGHQQQQLQHSKTETHIVQMVHSPAAEHHLIVLFPNEICLVQTQHCQLVCSAVIDAGSPLFQVLPCARRDALFLVHQNTLCSFRTAHFRLADERMSASLAFVRRCVAESTQRQSARVRLMGAALCPVTQSTVALLLNTGRIVVLQLETVSHCLEPYRIRTIDDILQQTDDDDTDDEALDSEMDRHQQLRLTQYGVYNPLGTSVTVVRMRPMEDMVGRSCPPPQCQPVEQQQQIDTDHDSGICTTSTAPPPTVPTTIFDGTLTPHLAAVGTSTGCIHLVDVFSGRIERDLQVHSCPVKCLEWCGPNAFISAAYLSSLSASSSTVRNDIFITDIRTGTKRRVRPEQEEGPVELLRVSHYGCYLAISFRSDPLEIWDLNTFRLLRRMSKKCPVIVDMAWSTKHHQVKLVNEKTQIHRENLVVLDNNNLLYHVVVKGLHVRDGKEVSTQWKSGAALLRCMVWKDDVLAFGDSAGRVGVWDLARSQCRQTGLSQSTRGPVQRVVFSRLTGDYTLAAQHPTSVVVWDTERLQSLFSLQKPGHSIIDIDMCGLNPVYIASDGMFRFAFSDTDEKSRTNNTNLNTSPPLIESDIPLLLRPSYCQALLSLLSTDTPPAAVAEQNNNNDDTTTKSNQENAVPFCGDHDDHQLHTFDDPDIDHLINRLSAKCCRTPLDRAIVLHQFVGQQSLADLGRIVQCAATTTTSTAGDDAANRPPPAQLRQPMLPPNLMLFWPKKAYQKRVERFTRLLLSTFRTERQLEMAIEKCVIMRKNDLALYYLLNNDQLAFGGGAATAARGGDARLNAFRACTLSASFATEESRCLVKLTATNLIASNFVSEGIQLLSLIDQAFDACKYLISQGLWHDSLAYAKMTPQCDFVEIFMRYANHLATEAIGRQSLALMVYASLACWERCRALLAQTASGGPSDTNNNKNGDDDGTAVANATKTMPKLATTAMPLNNIPLLAQQIVKMGETIALKFPIAVCLMSPVRSVVAHRTKVLSIYKHLLRRFCAEFELSDPDYLSQRIRDEFRANKELSNKQAEHKLKKLEQIVKQKLVI
ncbi:hypothetical protein niasHS_012566 [Heterodera schachtii]|uniref:WD repeat-containing protein 11 n=1 Tax=Heterodera schachtii TaxID=97005 RepID=A0ABD2I9C3_HETSC